MTSVTVHPSLTFNSLTVDSTNESLLSFYFIAPSISDLSSSILFDSQCSLLDEI